MPMDASILAYICSQGFRIYINTTIILDTSIALAGPYCYSLSQIVIIDPSKEKGFVVIKLAPCKQWKVFVVTGDSYSYTSLQN